MEIIKTQQVTEAKSTFSIVIPVSNNREQVIHRCLRSLINQTYPRELFEVLIVIDGNRDGTQWAMETTIKKYSEKFSFIKFVGVHKNRLERFITRNEGIKAAQNEWICHLDSDDAYLESYLDRMDWAIQTFSEYSMFNFGAIVCREGGHSIREPIELIRDMDFEAHKGRIGMGSFIYKRELHNEIGYFPEVCDPYSFADAANIPGYGRATKTLGNPSGDDQWLIHKLLKVVNSKKLDFVPYINYIRRSYNSPFYPGLEDL